MISCIIIDDETHAIELLKSHVSKVSFLDLKSTFTNPLEAITLLNNQEIDLVFIDIQMSQLSGLDFIRLFPSKTKFIVTSAFKEYALESFEYEVIDYLLKPISFDRFLKSVQKAMNQLAFSDQHAPADTQSYILVKTDIKKLQKVELEEIVYIEGLKNYVSIQRGPQPSIITLLNLKDLENSLPKDRFIRVHKSYIISIDKITTIEGNQVFLKNTEESIPLSETYKTAFFDSLRQRIIGNKKTL
jgi:DNA-binding LytR/AlgR family response regulator